MDASKFADLNRRLIASCGKIIIGKDEIIKDLTICLLASGHVLLEDLPGTGKTMLLRAFSKSIGGEFRRIQFTPDILPSDLTGINFYDQKLGEFRFRPGPLFASVILADEINRATPRSQSALLEVMEEKQITVDGQTYRMKEPYIVMATQNPVESFGTFPLPEAQLDRFFMRLSMGYMEREDELKVLARPDTKELLEQVEAVTGPDEIAELRRSWQEVRVSGEIADYIMNIIDATRSSKLLRYGVSARGSLALYRASQINAALEGRDYVLPEDVKKLAPKVLSHRVTMVRNSHLDNFTFIENMLDEIEVPMEKL